MHATSNTAFTCATHTAKPVNFFGKLRQMAAMARQRRQLAALDDHMLCDIGVCRKEAAIESAKAPWDVPATWRS